MSVWLYATVYLHVLQQHWGQEEEILAEKKNQIIVSQLNIYIV